MLGLAQVEWIFEAADSFVANVAPVAATKGGPKPPWGRVVYKLSECSALAYPVVVRLENLHEVGATLEIEDACADMACRPGNCRVKDLTLAPGANYDTILEVAPQFVEQACDGDFPVVVRTVHMAQRLEPGFLIMHHPPERVVTRWREECGVTTSRRPCVQPVDTQEIFDAVLLELPENARTEAVEDTSRLPGPDKLKRQKDPVKIIDALDFASMLRATKLFTPALNASARYDREAGDDDSEIERDSTNDPSRSNLDRAKARLDSTACLLERRLFHAAMATDSIAAINIFTDGP